MNYEVVVKIGINDRWASKKEVAPNHVPAYYAVLQESTTINSGNAKLPKEKFAEYTGDCSTLSFINPLRGISTERGASLFFLLVYKTST